METFVYKSNKKLDTYLFVNKKDDFSEVPEALIKVFGEPEFVMDLVLSAERKLAISDVLEVMGAMENQGFYLQLPVKELR